MSKAVAIVGMGCRFPGSPDVPGFWKTIEGGHVRVRDVPAHRWNHASFYDENPRKFDKTYAQKLGWLDDITSFSPEHFGILPRRARLMDPQQRIFLDVCRMALEDAGYGAGFPVRNTGVYLGISVSEHHQLASMRLNAWQMRDGDFGRVPPGSEAAWDFGVENAPPIQGYSMIGQMLNMAAANVSQSFDLRGPSFATDAACSSSLVALSEAVLHLRSGQCDAALVGGVYLAVKPDNMVCFSRIGAMSLKDTCRPFDERADGFVLGEGAGSILLKRLEDAERDGDRIWAVVRGFGVSSDGRSEGPMTPRRLGQEDALRRAYRDAGFGPETLQYIEAHGTGTRVGDATEAGSLCTLIAENGAGPANISLGAVKANIGHTIAAAGVAGIIKTSLALRHQVIPPMANFDAPRDLGLAESGFQVPTSAARWSGEAGPRRAGVSSFGFGGTNVHIVLEEGARARRGLPVKTPLGAASAAPAKVQDPEPQLFVLSAPTKDRVQAFALRLHAVLDASGAPPSLVDIAYTLATRRLDPVRAAVYRHDPRRIARPVACGGA